MGRQIDRDVVPERGEVGAVIEIPAAQIILVGFSLTGMLDHCQAGRRFEKFAGPRHRAGIQVFAGNRQLTGCGRRNLGAAANVGSAGFVWRRR